MVAFLLLGVGNGILTWAEQWLPAGIASLIIVATPFWMVLFASLGGEAVRARAVGGLVVGFFGLAMVLWPDLRVREVESGFVLGAVCLCFSSAAWAYGSVYSKKHSPKGDPWMAIALQMLLGAVYLGVFGLLVGEAGRWVLTRESIWAMLYLVAFGSIVGYSSYIYALDHLPTEVVAIYAYVNPLVAVFLGVFLLGERMDVFMVFGAPLVLWGIYLVNSARPGTSTAGGPLKGKKAARARL